MPFQDNGLNPNKGTKRDVAISLIPFDRLDFRTLGNPQNGAPFGVTTRKCAGMRRDARGGPTCPHSRVLSAGQYGGGAPAPAFSHGREAIWPERAARRRAGRLARFFCALSLRARSATTRSGSAYAFAPIESRRRPTWRRCAQGRRASARTGRAPVPVPW
jgi:hypothetical protein